MVIECYLIAQLTFPNSKTVFVDYGLKVLNRALPLYWLSVLAIQSKYLPMYDFCLSAD